MNYVNQERHNPRTAFKQNVTTDKNWAADTTSTGKFTTTAGNIVAFGNVTKCTSPCNFPTIEHENYI